MNDHNLIPQAHELTVEEASRGGKASVETRRRRKAMKASMDNLLSLPAGERAARYMELVKDPRTATDPTLQDEMLAALLALALTGDVAAIKQVREIVRDDDRLKIEQERLKLEKKKLEKNDDGLEKLDEILDQIRGTAAEK